MPRPMLAEHLNSIDTRGSVGVGLAPGPRVDWLAETCPSGWRTTAAIAITPRMRMTMTVAATASP